MEDLAQHILDIGFNSLEAGATRLEITVREDVAANLLEFKVVDNGRGIDERDLTRLLDPFYTTKKHKRVGLGIPLLREAVDRCGGTLEIKGAPSRGTLVRAVFPYGHIDRAPLGDITGTLITLLAGHGFLHLKYIHQYDGRLFNFSTKDVKAVIGDITLQEPEVLAWLEGYLNANLTDLRRETSEELGRAG